MQRENKVDEFIRDVTQVGSIPKSEVRRRLNEIVSRAVAEEREAWIVGQRCTSCGKEMENGGLSDTCGQCWEEL